MKQKLAEFLMVSVCLVGAVNASDDHVSYLGSPYRNIGVGRCEDLRVMAVVPRMEERRGDALSLAQPLREDVPAMPVVHYRGRGMDGRRDAPLDLVESFLPGHSLARASGGGFDSDSESSDSDSGDDGRFGRHASARGARAGGGPAEDPEMERARRQFRFEKYTYEGEKFRRKTEDLPHKMAAKRALRKAELDERKCKVDGEKQKLALEQIYGEQKEIMELVERRIKIWREYIETAIYLQKEADKGEKALIETAKKKRSADRSWLGGFWGTVIWETDLEYANPLQKMLEDLGKARDQHIKPIEDNIKVAKKIRDKAISELRNGEEILRECAAQEERKERAFHSEEGIARFFKGFFSRGR